MYTAFATAEAKRFTVPPAQTGPLLVAFIVQEIAQLVVAVDPGFGEYVTVPAAPLKFVTNKI